MFDDKLVSKGAQSNQMNKMPIAARILVPWSLVPTYPPPLHYFQTVQINSSPEPENEGKK
jgi:hypothetical protein